MKQGKFRRFLKNHVDPWVATFGYFCLIVIGIFSFGYLVTWGSHRADAWYDTQQDLVDKYFVCQKNMEQLGNAVCAERNLTFNYYVPVGFGYGGEAGNFQYIDCRGSDYYNTTHVDFK